MKDTAPKKLKPKRIALVTLKRGIKDFQEDSENISSTLDEIAKESDGNLVIDRPRVEAFRAVSRKGERKYKAVIIECYALPPDVRELISPWKTIGEAIRTPVIVLWPKYYQYESRPTDMPERTRYFRMLYQLNGSVKRDIRDFLQERGIISRRREGMEGQIVTSGKERI